MHSHAKNVGNSLFFFFIFIYLFICPENDNHIIAVTTVPVHELDKKANKLALTISHNKPLHYTQSTS